MRKTIKVKFIGFWPDFDYQHNFFTNVLEKYFNVVISDTPDYVFCSVLGAPYEECNYQAIRIHYNGENYTPDFNIHDYGISFNKLTFGDRHLQYPLYLVYYDYLNPAQRKHLNVDEATLKNKEYFCNYIYGVDRDYRSKALMTFSKYKKVMSPGMDNNNMPEHPIVKTQTEKIAFQKKCKFTIAFDSISMQGFVTEKILHAFAAQTIPIYYGDPNISTQFNKKAFIDVADYDYDLDKVLEKIEEIDNNDELYLDMLKEPTFLSENYIIERHQEFEKFLINIFDQDLEKAYRRSKIAAPLIHEERLKEYNSFQKNKIYNFLKGVRNKYTKKGV